ncbi:hypothetical protein [Pseudomonas sp. ACM7]|uniref:hypothetical protein n=1 Tax=Pseudomonas sp. ACM7 TaxID=2052956 RepID=UPI0010110F12|nr:hypothetical protein [Pseudomonas sp. ACM7]QAY92533.1 hypothetical protein CUN63_22665 [Pseudomonas sp. ACM7]
MKQILSVLVLAMAVTAHAEPFKGAGPESFEQATKQMNALSKAMTDGAAILKSGDLAAVGAHSKYISSLVDSGKSQFGNTIFEPLGSCFAAGNSSRTWWSAQLAAAHNGGVEKVPGSIKGAFDEYQEKRDDCLRSANPVTSAKADAESDADLKGKTGAGRECLTVFTVDPETREVVEKPKPSHCKG